jgi:hypothetical protein
MRKHSSILILLLLMMTAAACNPAENENDPIRVEFISGCEGLRAYSSMKPDRRTSMCKCIYDTAMRGLSEQEKNGARFYLLEQAGIDAKSKNLVSISDLNVMGTAAKAVGDAVKQCPRN